MAEYWIDIHDHLNRVANVYGRDKMYEKLVPKVVNELKANEGKNCFFDFSHVANIYDVDLIDSIVEILKAYGMKSNNIHAAFASEEDKETFRVLFPKALAEYIIFNKS